MLSQERKEKLNALTRGILAECQEQGLTLYEMHRLKIMLANEIDNRISMVQRETPFTNSADDRVPGI